MTPQTYANHVYRPVAWLVIQLTAFVVFVLLAWVALRTPSLPSVAVALLALVVTAAVFLLRVFALRLQNRIIRLEMQVRLAGLGRDAAMTRLAMPQLVALRFAPDAELPSLIDRALAERLTADQIKRAVRVWHGDDLRT